MFSNIRSTLAPSLLVIAELLYVPEIPGQEPIMPVPAVSPQVFWIQFPDGSFSRYEHSNTHRFREGEVLTLVDGYNEKWGVVRLQQPTAAPSIPSGTRLQTVPTPPGTTSFPSDAAATLVLPPRSTALEADQFSLAHAQHVIRYFGPVDIKGEVLIIMSEAHTQLSDSWLGHKKPLPPISIHLEVADQSPQGSASFSWLESATQSIEMNIRAKTSDMATVLWHEMNHVVLRLHFGSALPRWIDEGCAMTVERQDQQDALTNLLVHDYLRNGRGISFNQMLSQMGVPSPQTAGPFYGQSMTTVSFLLDSHPQPEASLTDKRRYFMQFVEMVMQGGGTLSAYEPALSKFYGLKNPSELQIKWLDSLRQRYVRE